MQELALNATIRNLEIKLNPDTATFTRLHKAGATKTSIEWRSGQTTNKGDDVARQCESEQEIIKTVDWQPDMCASCGTDIPNTRHEQ